MSASDSKPEASLAPGSGPSGEEPRSNTSAETNNSKPTPDSRTEYERMISGEPYLAMTDPSLLLGRLRVRRPMQAYNNYPWPDSKTTDDYFGPDERRALLADVFGLTVDEIKSKPLEIEPPFYIDYGTNVTFEGSFYANFDLILLDCAPIKFGTRVLCGPRVGFYAATHSTDVDERQGGYERAYPIEIGDDCWIGGGAIINGPSKIGKGCTVAAGAVVRGDFPDYCVIGGVPARILKHLEPPKGRHNLDNYR